MVFMNRQAVLARLEAFEGSVPFMYRCTGGEVTVGIGHALPSAAAAVELAWVLAGRPASAEEVTRDYTAIATLQKGLVAAHYASFSQCRLTDESVTNLANADITRVEATIAAALPRWNSYPEPVQEALFDMAFNVGIGGLLKFVKLLACVNAGKWDVAAKECQRQGVAAERNQAIASLFLAAVKVKPGA